MTKHVNRLTPPARPAGAAEPESLDQLRGDCARMAPRWRSAHRTPPAPDRAAELHGVRVSPASAALVDGMSEYSD
ncbi:hypothetical protein [Streptomyces catenulae]|uniref:Uncharacterized protein n=1 Tax=Streptomyces catenulae TaxID=66875 RepID=A0ABV2YWF3_9ACTN|nr:hypothetical protein [Streptomyces catenulae]